MYINTQTNQYPVSEQVIRRLYSNTSFPTPFAPPAEYQWVFPVPQPSYNTLTEKAVEGTPELVSGRYQQTWQVVPKFETYTDMEGIIHTKEEQEQAAIAQDSALKAERLQKNVVDATQKRLDDFAKTKSYDGILSLCTYATSTNSKFQSEGQYGVEVRDATWAKLYDILAEVQAGTRPMPTGYSEIEPELPELQWPAII